MRLCLFCTGFVVRSPTPSQQVCSPPRIPPTNALTHCPTKSWCHAIEGPLLLFLGLRYILPPQNDSDWALEWVHTVLVMATVWPCLMGEDHKGLSSAWICFVLHNEVREGDGYKSITFRGCAIKKTAMAYIYRAEAEVLQPNTSSLNHLQPPRLN